MRRVFIMLFLTIVSLTTFGQSNEDHLEPAEGYFSMYEHHHNYYPFIYKHLIKNLSDIPVARMLTLPSFEPESVLSIETTNNEGTGYSVIYKVCKENIWYQKDRNSIEVVEYVKEIDSTMGDLIEKIFQKALLETKYHKNNRAGDDGVVYIFSAFVLGSGIEAGQVWSPSKGTKMRELVLIGEYLIELAKSNNDADSLVFKNVIMRQGGETIRKIK